MKMGRIAVGLVAGLVSWVGCGGQPQEERAPAEATQELEQSCVYAYFECGYRGYQYPYAWPAACAGGMNTHAMAFEACLAECPWMCIDTGDIGPEP
ncbi:hypothetical protein A176_000910 [Myxococcus hansupus]|uniref:Lipoprotein n=1 Tax=Pseudomyxococcus hansupus TaxID=1297742 RepID=A0A0H4WR21_9BACT|nr:hypothetical protein [Myxococcus hansupus]AKQ63998.1 hypothetical protein A176_000910 [Myxococcus hansupus]